MADHVNNLYASLCKKLEDVEHKKGCEKVEWLFFYANGVEISNVGILPNNGLNEYGKQPIKAECFGCGVSQIIS